jgi:hypothetical protein
MKKLSIFLLLFYGYGVVSAQGLPCDTAIVLHEVVVNGDGLQTHGNKTKSHGVRWVFNAPKDSLSGDVHRLHALPFDSVFLLTKFSKLNEKSVKLSKITLCFSFHNCLSAFVIFGVQ